MTNSTISKPIRRWRGRPIASRLDRCDGGGGPTTRRRIAERWWSCLREAVGGVPRNDTSRRARGEVDGDALDRERGAGLPPLVRDGPVRPERAGDVAAPARRTLGGRRVSGRDGGVRRLTVPPS